MNQLKALGPTFAVFGSPVSEPNLLVGEREDPDVNPGTQYGNDLPALPIELTFVDPRDPACPGTTPRVTLQVVYANTGNITRLDAYGLDGTLVDSDTATVDLGVLAAPLSVEASTGIHRAVVTFDAAGTGGIFEDSAGVDGIRPDAREKLTTSACRELTTS